MMRKNVTILLVATFMILSSLAIGIEAATSGNGNGALTASPAVAPSSYSGNVYIYANGTVSNSSVVSHNGNSYTLLTNVSGTVYVQRNNTLLVGNGLFVNGAGNYALDIEYVSGVTVTGVNATSAVDAVYLNGATDITFKNSNISANSNGVDAASIYNTNFVWFINDNVTALNGYGLYANTHMVGLYISNSLFTVGSAVYSDNSMNNFSMTGNTINVVYSSSTSSDATIYNGGTTFNDVTITNNVFNATSTSVNAYFIYSYGSTDRNINITNNVFKSQNMGVLYLDADLASNVTFSENLVLGSSAALYIDYVSNFIVENNQFTNSSGEVMYLYESISVVISGNTFYNYTSTNSYFLDLEDNSGMQVYGNSLLGNGLANYNTGIYLYYDAKSLAFNNTVSGVYYGIYVEGTMTSNVFDNTVLNTTDGLYVDTSSVITAYGNYLGNSSAPVYITGTYGFTMYDNQVVDSPAGSSSLLTVTSSGSLNFYHNNFMGPYNNVSVSSSNLLGFNQSLPVGGNYWSTYNGTGTDGIGSTQYNLSTGYADYLPLTSMWSGYTVTFVEQGLAAGTQWNVDFNGQSTSTGSSMVFSQDAAQHISVPYSVSPVKGYTLSSSSGTVLLDGSSKVVTLVFTPASTANPAPAKYNLTIEETGLPSGIQWNATVNGTVYQTTGTFITVQVQNGAYNVTVSAPTGYTVSSSQFNATVNGADSTSNVVFAANSGNSASGSSTGTYVGAGIGAAVGAIAASIGTMFYTGTGFFKKP